MFQSKEHNILPDAERVQTKAIQNLIDRCAVKGGGEIVFTPGDYVTGTLELCNNLTLRFERGARLLGSTAGSDYKFFKKSPIPFHEGTAGIRALLFAYQKHGIMLCGDGIIDGRGTEIQGKFERSARPRVLWFGDCEDISIRELKLRHSAFWMCHFICCRKIRVTDISIWNHGCRNNDGIDIDSCRDVLIEGCNIDSYDDAICIKCGTFTPCENIQVRDCLVHSYCVALKLGTETNGGFRNIRFSDIQILPSDHYNPQGAPDGGDARGIAGIGLMTVDGGFMENVFIENVFMASSRIPLFIRLGDRRRAFPGAEANAPAWLKNVFLRNIRAEKAEARGCYIVGLPEKHLQNIVFQDCDFEFTGGGLPEWMTSQIAEERETFPTGMEFGMLPAYGFFIRYTDGICFRNVRFRALVPDPRPAVTTQFCQDVKLEFEAK